MKKHLWFPLCAVTVVTAVALAVAGPPAARNFTAHCTGAEEVPPRDTDGQGQAHFKLSKDELSLAFKLNVANIDNVIASHIHVGPVGANGPVVAFLAGPFPAGGGASNGGLGQGTITAANLVGPLTGQPLSALISQMRAGNTYVNVHTDDGVAPTNTGAGDFPGGEIRGQIDAQP